LHARRIDGGLIMWVDQIVEQVRSARREYAEQFGFDLQALAADLRQREKQHVGRVVSFPPKPATRRKTA
jgi:hypothetical protein